MTGCELCDGMGQVHHGEGALSFVTMCPNGCAAKVWDRECDEAARRAGEARAREEGIIE